MKYNRLSRRLFLQGAGAALALPLLPSLLPRVAQAAASDIPPRYFSLFLPYGPTQDNWWPTPDGMSKTTLFPPTSQLPVYEIASKTLSPSLTGPAYLFDQKFNPYVAKMTFLRGLDVPHAGGHYAFSQFGNARGSDPKDENPYTATPTIDHIMAYAPGFYPNNGLGSIRQIVAGINSSMNYGEGFAYGFENTGTRSGNVVQLSGIYQHNPRLLFQVVFGGYQPKETTSTPIVDAVLEDYKKVQNGRNIGSVDKLAMQNHIDLLAQLEQKLNTNTTLQCTLPPEPVSLPGLAPWKGPTDSKTQAQLINDVIFAAFRCQISRVASFNLHFHHYSKLHIHESDEPFSTLKANQKWGSDNIVFDIIKKMDSFTESNGKTLLDNSIVHYSAGSGPYSHSPTSFPSLLFGSANGKIKSGQYIDYRMQNPLKNYNMGSLATGLLQNQLWATLMQAMGLAPSSYNMQSLGFVNASGAPTGNIYGEYRDISDTRYRFRYVDPEKIAGNFLPLL